jgi:hypothetical protein
MAGIVYARLRDGSWGIRADGVKIEPGRTVTVRKRDGTEQAETVGRVVWSGDGVTLASLVAREPRGGRVKSGGRVCAACGRGGRLVRDLEDGLVKHYNCCDIPPD